MNTKVLELQFLTTDGKSRTLKVNSPNELLDPLTVHEAMDQIIAADLFYIDDIQLYHTKKGARYVENIVTSIFEAN